MAQVMKQKAGEEATGARRPVGHARARLLSMIPLTERTLDLAGVQTAVLEGGDGPPVVLLHGPGEYAAKWVRVLPELVKNHRVVAPDLPGHGESKVPGGRIETDRVLEWLKALIAQTCAAPPALVGQILGGAIAARFAISDGRRLDRLVLVDALGLGFVAIVVGLGIVVRALDAGVEVGVARLAGRGAADDAARAHAVLGRAHLAVGGHGYAVSGVRITSYSLWTKPPL